ncbi:UNVERIFIED_CONTAM: hypothetical protein FKN15_014591 [Acipenser sinensis]
MKSPTVSSSRGRSTAGRSPAVFCTRARGAADGVTGTADGARGITGGYRGGEEPTTTAPTTTPAIQSGATACGPLPLAPGNPASLPRHPGARPGAQESAPSATALPLVPYSALPEHPDVAGLLPEVAGVPPVRCFAPPG